MTLLSIGPLLAFGHSFVPTGKAQGSEKCSPDVPAQCHSAVFVCYVPGICGCLPSLSIPLFLTFRTFQMSLPPQIPSETAHGRQAQVLLPEESEVGLT